ncbi:TVP38/TMEM64 family protein [Corynebacterium genitalium ATCC 33030]|uniref:TVP38/TMEM64 family membrane protein n=1 Tax=Corynebacterium genitalium ATCC 33030 TaxID=585529 RepID=D7WCR1_9CORY|nr:TVP38/TMEM64 family protein [Corynebacterium genitalium]EFK53942.1 SNARE-like domain protein [Corynebacterium genitalium ATCC 33030]UUA88511.1 TVP38/TMEM64 family protein [Corynebacterium genitalium ATCC 33030]
MRDPRRIAALLVAVVAFVALWMLLDVPDLATLRAWADQTGPWFPVVFWLLYILITQFPIPRTVMTISAGILFGTVQGILLALTATTVAGTISLLIVRFLLRDWIEPRLTHPSVLAINQRLEERGWLAILSLRMIAGIPFSILNYTAALTRVRVVPFTVATLIGSAPGTILVTIFGDTLTGEANPVFIAIMAVLAVAGLAGLLIDARLPTRQSPTLDH